MPEDQQRSEDGEVRRTTDPTLLRSVIEERGGYPGHVERSEGTGDSGLLRVGFRDGGERAEELTEVSWETFADEFEEKGLVGLYTDDGSDVDGLRPVVLRSRDAPDTGE